VDDEAAIVLFETPAGSPGLPRIVVACKAIEDYAGGIIDGSLTQTLLRNSEAQSSAHLKSA
jgi:hypothetical protein